MIVIPVGVTRSYVAAVRQRTANRCPQLLVISVDGLDYRYLRDADRLNLKIPNLRRLLREGEVTEGITGVYPTVTWPSHTSLITGVTPAAHGILGNRRPKNEGGDYYWDVSLLKTKTLWHAARAAGLKTAAITWPVTVGAQIDYNLPEFFRRRNGGAMDTHSIGEKSTPADLVERITRFDPTFPREWVGDRERTIATVYLLKNVRPDLTLLHLVDLDAEAHENGPFSPEANATLEYTDELIGQMIRAAAPRTIIALVSDHGFERADKVVNVNALLARQGRGAIAGVQANNGLLTARDAAAAVRLREAARDPAYGIGREIPREELQQYAPRLAAEVAAAFEPAEHYLFGPAAEGEPYTAPAEKGVHGLWPARKDYRSVFVLWGGGTRAARRPADSMLNIAPRLATLLNLKLEKSQ